MVIDDERGRLDVHPPMPTLPRVGTGFSRDAVLANNP